MYTKISLLDCMVFGSRFSSHFFPFQAQATTLWNQRFARCWSCRPGTCASWVACSSSFYRGWSSSHSTSAWVCASGTLWGMYLGFFCLLLRERRIFQSYNTVNTSSNSILFRILNKVLIYATARDAEQLQPEIGFLLKMFFSTFRHPKNNYFL